MYVGVWLWMTKLGKKRLEFMSCHFSLLSLANNALPCQREPDHNFHNGIFLMGNFLLCYYSSRYSHVLLKDKTISTSGSIACPVALELCSEHSLRYSSTAPPKTTSRPLSSPALSKARLAKTPRTPTRGKSVPRPILFCAMLTMGRVGAKYPRYLRGLD